MPIILDHNIGTLDRYIICIPKVSKIAPASEIK